ncbi:MAG: AbrB/MazE/SpoVT family DNA-binding domain-containing protein [Candidatus Vogelbacteria bacterium CG10_big_fil_rev_8_21_14_0_10_45_14]|uniref:AbrB/MazE/SpoVT family DNA-binding domain-containing protein n=1 Tax=Candidatus Vogelbacteria bacterium CG10_big_fil_rev_8_21_14_0_10_45_14 TaxID=1975042 RepID=A0A2H0RJV7_9BACT|nr:MAG: AbrB/MazE/SpoVT family DNA-binding domain-containing protein [Candidatus Vogelbacteria bacterium CG10_big_fil_rev_8_21_14_0_10_45_14]
MEKTTTIQKWGNSYAVRLPLESVRRVNLREGVEVRIVEDKSSSSLHIVPTSTRSTLKEMVGAINKKNKHGEIRWGNGRGREVW